MGRHLVYSEGTVTEPNYVNNIKNLLPIDPKHVNELLMVPSSKTLHTCQLIERAERDVEKRLKKHETITGVWIFFDKDSFEDFDKACKLLEDKNKYKNNDGIKADENGIVWHSCWSVQCFELWCYLHFENLVVGINRADYIKKINEFAKKNGCETKYKKNLDNIYSWLINAGGDVEKAIKLARKKDNNKLPKDDPSTGIYSFMEFFKAYFH